MPDFNLQGVPGGALNWAIPLGVVALVSGVFLFVVLRLRKSARAAAPPPAIDDRTMTELEDTTFADELDEELAALD